jgi:hypothetical protein
MWRWYPLWIEDEGTQQSGQAAVGAVAVRWSCMETFSTVTWVRCTACICGNRVVANVWSSLHILSYDTALRHQPPLYLTKNDDDPECRGEL